jgi:hypothetical protein
MPLPTRSFLSLGTLVSEIVAVAPCRTIELNV